MLCLKAGIYADQTGSRMESVIKLNTAQSLLLASPALVQFY
jgi:hypothetical protein